MKPNAESVQAAMADFANAFDAKLGAQLWMPFGEKVKHHRLHVLGLHQTSMTDYVNQRASIWTLSDASLLNAPVIGLLSFAE